ncbi:MAG: transcriptional regulator [Bacteroidetes bacterium]|nr:transcriptional regulator [Bacteroidota bacterium]
MKNIIAGLNKMFNNRLRIGIMAILVVNDWVEFNNLKELLEATDGNLASHIKALELEDYIEVKKQCVGRKPKTSYRATIIGRTAFEDHINGLSSIMENVKK